jgi:hypothetical protein
MHALLLAFAALFSPQPDAAESQWRHPMPLDPLYARIADDLRDGKPLIFAHYYGMWFTRADQPDNNLNWGMRWGHATMLRKAGRDAHIRKNYRYTAWKAALRTSAEQDPKRIHVYRQTVRPNARWRALGVQKPFEVFLVMQAFTSQEGAAKAMTTVLRQAQDQVLTLDDGTRLDVGQAQVTAYFGHNFFYDYKDFQWDGLDRISGRPQRPVGIAAVGCNTGRVPGFKRLVDKNVMVLLYSRSLMASEGYSTLALTDGVLRQMSSKQLVRFGDSTYRYFQQLGKPGRRVGRPFVGHDHLLYPNAPRAAR